MVCVDLSTQVSQEKALARIIAVIHAFLKHHHLPQPDLQANPSETLQQASVAAAAPLISNIMVLNCQAVFGGSPDILNSISIIQKELDNWGKPENQPMHEDLWTGLLSELFSFWNQLIQASPSSPSSSSSRSKEKSSGDRKSHSVRLHGKRCAQR